MTYKRPRAETDNAPYDPVENESRKVALSPAPMWGPIFPPFFCSFFPHFFVSFSPLSSLCREPRSEPDASAGTSPPLPHVALALAIFESDPPVAYIPNVTRVPLRRGNIISLFADSINFGEGNGVRAIYRTCSLRTAGASETFHFVSNAADQNHNLSHSRKRADDIARTVLAGHTWRSSSCRASFVHRRGWAGAAEIRTTRGREKTKEGQVARRQAGRSSDEAIAHRVSAW